jgi:hypothetical protein
MHKNIAFLLISFFLYFLSACTSTPKQTLPEESRSKVGAVSPIQEFEPVIDYMALRGALGLGRSTDALGLTEKAFNSCEAGFGYSSTQNCRRLYFTLVHFQLLCRDSEGTVSTGIDRVDQMPISRRTVAWSLKGNGGASETDADGFAQIQLVSQSSQRKQRLKLSVGNDFLYMRANEITKVVTPKSWCN